MKTTWPIALGIYLLMLPEKMGALRTHCWDHADRKPGTPGTRSHQSLRGARRIGV